MNKNVQRTLIESIAIAIGCAIYAFSLDSISIPNQLADGGLSGVALILRYWFHIDPGLSTLILNIPLIILGYRYMNRRQLVYTIWGTSCLSFFLYFWTHIFIINQIDLKHDLFLTGLLAGVVSGIGIGIVFRFNGTTGGTDIIARVLNLNFNIPIGRSLLVCDAIVLLASLTYLDLPHMMYTLLASFVLARVTDTVQQGAYQAKGLFIISNKNDQIAQMIDLQLERGYTFIKGEGGYQGQQRKILYCIVSPREIGKVKSIILNEDPKAFVTIFDVYEAVGEGFTYKRRSSFFNFRK